jgi:hypothetical protein
LAPAPPPPEEPEPRGLFAPRGNIGWEEYTQERLEAELHRCEVSEDDLVFIAMDFKDPGAGVDGNSLYRQFAAEAVNFFVQRDLVFEKGERGLSIIFPAIDLEQGFSKSEEFRDWIQNNLSADFQTSIDVCIGLSARAGRLVDAERIMFEAVRALEKALNDPVSHIVAFKSDPEKYRDFIRARGE